MHLQSLAFQWNKLKLSVQLELRYSIEQLITRELNNNYTPDLVSHKISVICTSDDVKRENIQKAWPRFVKTTSERLDPQKTERKLWHEPRKSSNTNVFPLLGALDLTGSALRININAGFFRSRLGGLLSLPGVPYLHVNRPLKINVNNFIFCLAAAKEVERKRNQEGYSSSFHSQFITK